MEVQARKKQCITFLPEDIIEQILVWLPASTLTRYRIVCKQWNRIIGDPQFIMAHLQHAPHHLLIFYNRASISNKLYPSEAIIFDKSWSPSRWVVPFIEPDDFLCASCNGLLLLYSDKSTIKIGNPTTGECLHIAKPGKNLTGDHYHLYNFGFHPVTKEYKIIHILCQKRPYGNKFNTIQVYTLGEDKWRDIRVPEFQGLYDVERSGVVIVDGAMYWLNGKKDSKWGRVVVSFELSEERFEWIQLPANADLANSARGCYRLYYITEVDGKVCVVTGQERYNVYRGLVGKLQIWSLDNRIDQSWSQKYSIQFSSDNIPRPYFIHGGKIVVYDYGRNMYCQELMGQNNEIGQRKMMKLFNYSPRWCRSMRSYMHVESLVRLDVYRKAGIVRTPKRREGWESMKWVWWTHELRVLRRCGDEPMQWSISYLNLHVGLAWILIRSWSIRRNLKLPNLPAHIFVQLFKPHYIFGVHCNLKLSCMQIQLNWVERKRVRGMLNASMKRLTDIVMDMERTMDAIQSKKMMIHGTDQSSSTPNADTSEQSMTTTSLKLVLTSIRCLLAALAA